MLKSLFFLLTAIYNGVKLLFPKTKAYAVVNGFDKYTSTKFEELGNSTVEQAKPFLQMAYLISGIFCLLIYVVISKIFGDKHEWVQNGGVEAVIFMMAWVLYGFIPKMKFHEIVSDLKVKFYRAIKIELSIVIPLLTIWLLLQITWGKDYSAIINDQITWIVVGILGGIPVVTTFAFLISISALYILKKISDLMIWAMIRVIRFSQIKKPDAPIAIIFYIIGGLIGVLASIQAFL